MIYPLINADIYFFNSTILTSPKFYVKLSKTKGDKMQEKIKQFAELLENQQIERLKECKLDCEANIINARVYIKEGKKYTKVNVGTSGKYMIDKDGNIFGIKGYGVINKGHYFGTLDTINQYYWGDYRAYKI